MDGDGQGIRRSILDVSSESQVSGCKPALEGEVLQGGEAFQSYDADIEKTNVDSAPPERMQKNLPAATLEETLESGSRYGLRPRRTTKKKHDCDHINSGLLEFSDDEREICGKGVAAKQLRNAKQSRIWGDRRRRTNWRSFKGVPNVTSRRESNEANEVINLRDQHGRAKISQDDMAERLKEQSSQEQGHFDRCYNGREAPPCTQLPQDDITASKEKHPGRSSDLRNSVAGDREITPGSSLSSEVRRIGSPCRLDRDVRWRVSHIEVSPRDLGGCQEGSAATPTKKAIRKRKAGILAPDEFPEATGLDGTSNRRSRPDCAEIAVPQQWYQFSSEREEVAGRSHRLVAARPTSPPLRTTLQHRLEMSDAFVRGEFGRAETSVHGSHLYSGRETLPPLPLDDSGNHIGFQSHNSSQLGEGVQHRDAFSLASEPSANDSQGTTQFEARPSSDDGNHLPDDHPASHSKIHNLCTPIPTSSYPSKSRRSLSFRTDRAPQRVGPKVVRGPPNHPNNAVLYANPILDNRDASFGSSGFHSMDDEGMAVLDGDEDYEPDERDLLDEEGEEGLLDLNESPEQPQGRPKTSRVRKKHRPKVFREGRPDRRRKSKNAEEGVSKAKAGEGKKVNVKPSGRKKHTTSDHLTPEAANCGPGIGGCGQCQDNERISDGGRGMHSSEGAMGTEDSFRRREESRFPQAEGPQTSPSKIILVMGPNNSLMRARIDPSSPNGQDCSALASISSASPSPSRKRSGGDEGVVVADSPLRRVRRELFKQARTKRITAHVSDLSGWGEKWQESMEAIGQPSAGSPAKAVGTRPRMGTVEPQEPCMEQGVRDPAAEIVGAAMSITYPSNSEEGVSHALSIISTEMGSLNGSIAIPEESCLQASHGRLKAAARATAKQPNSSNPVKRPYTRRPKQTDSVRLIDLVVDKMADMELEEIDSGLQLVVHANQERAMIPYTPSKEKKPRARVMLDEEDKRVWRLLMAQGTDFEDDSSEQEAKRHWEEERAIMKGRAEKFINRMHLVQGDRRFSVWKGSVVDSVVGAFLTQNVSDILSSSAFMCLAARFPVARKKKPAAGTSQEATVTEVQVEEARESSPNATGDPTFRGGAGAVQEGMMTAFHVEEAFEISEKSSATGEVSSICCDQKGHDTLSTKVRVMDSERDGEPTCQILERSAEITVQEHTEWDLYGAERLTDPREQNSSCSSKTSQSQSNSNSNSNEHNATCVAGVGVEVRESEEHKTCGVVEDSMSLHWESGEVFLGCSGQGQLNSFDSTPLLEVGNIEVAKTPMPVLNSWIQPESEPVEGSLVHNITSHAGDSLEVRESEEHKICRIVENSISLHSGSGDVFLGSSTHGQLNSIDSIALVEAGQSEATTMTMPAPSSWIQSECQLVEGSLIVDLSATDVDNVTDFESTLEAIHNDPDELANNSLTHEMRGNSIPQQQNWRSVSPGLEVIYAAAEEIAASSGSVVSSPGSLDASKLSQSSARSGSENKFAVSEELGAHSGERICPVDSFDTNKSYHQQIVTSPVADPSEQLHRKLDDDQQIGISSVADPSEQSHRQLDVSCTTDSSHLRTMKTFTRTKSGTKGQPMRKGLHRRGLQSLGGKSNSELVNSASDNLDTEIRGPKKRPVLSHTGIDRARLEQSNTTSKVAFDWEAVRLKSTGQEMGDSESAHAGCKSFGSSDVENGVDWDAVRSAKLEEIADVIKERGMNFVLAGRIKAFLERVQNDHGSVDLEWLRRVSVEEAKSFLLSIRGLGLKSVECIRLLTLHHLAFPVDTNVGRICVRLGWVPLEPLPEELQLHLLELYPVQETIQKYLWPRLCTLDQRTLYELHYQMITFGKVFCTKSRPNCNACPMRDECRHFASALASARLALPAAAHEDPQQTNSEPLALPAPATEFLQKVNPALSPSRQDDVSVEEEGVELPRLNSVLLPVKPCEPIVEEPKTPEAEIGDMEDFEAFAGVSSQPSGSEKGSSSEIELVLPPAEVLIHNSVSKALVVLPPDSASIPVPKLKNVGRLRTVHYVYELPDNHPLVLEMDLREDDDPCFYLLAIWSPGESPQAPPVLDDVYTSGTCDGFNGGEEETVKGTLLVPCRTAMRGTFPLNGTYFQVNEVFADHASSLQPIEVPRTLLWNLRRRFVYFGTSVTSIFKGLSTQEIQACFWRGYVCVRGFDSVSRCPRPLVARLHFPASKMVKKQKGEKSGPFNADHQN